ncbi:nucleotidyltransferase [Echinicola soli]|uniref:Nucleotidyltransferase n=1 Tax=Echinicola soli TaxID=2591634 RepID=A0A514CG33_9BACT|nr:sugar phosphate nucleotidyltransferase [Echinicola soli]QDH78785.1 nucleotidyltransferase [Echinicola soli]
MNKPTLLILAAGIGSRYGGNKQIEGFGPNGETIIEYSIFDAIRAGFGKVVFIVRREILETVKEIFLPKLEGKIAVDFVVQSLDSLVPEEFQTPDRKKPYGTGHAVLCAKDAINKPFAVINADDFYGKEAFQALGKFLKEDVKEDLHCMVGYAIKNVLSENGTVSRGVCETNENFQLIGMTERTGIAREKDEIICREEEDPIVIAPDTPVSMNCWGFHPSFFEEAHRIWKAFLPENKDNIKSEFYIPSVANTLIEEKKANIAILEGGKTWFGVTYPEDKPVVVSALKRLHDQGDYPDGLWE